MKHQKRIISALLALAATAAPCRAVLTVTTSAGVGEPHFYTSTPSAPLTDGMFYQLGTFPIGTDPALAAGSPAQAFASWQTFATDAVYTHPITLESGAAGNDVSGLDAFTGKPVYWWVFFTTDGQPPDPSFVNVAEHALFTGPSSSWVFPAMGGGLPPVVSTGDTLTFAAGSLSSGQVQLTVAVPEPSSVLLLGLLACGQLARRSRRA